MRVLIDTNVLISAALSANGTILSVALLALELIPVPVEEVMTETQIRDVRMKDDNFSATCPVTVPRAFVAFLKEKITRALY